MKLSISNIAWSPENNKSVYTLLKHHGVNAIEIAPTLSFNGTYTPTSSEIKKYLDVLEKYNLAISSMQSLLYGKDNLKLFDSLNSRTDLKTHLEQVIKLANSLNCTNIVFGSPKNRNIEMLQFQEAETIALDFFNEIGKIAAKHNINFLIEPNPKEYGTNFLNTTLDTIEFLTKLNNPNIGLNLDMSTVMINKEDLNEVFKNSKNFIKHVHLSQPFLNPISNAESLALYTELINRLLDNNYKSYVSIEMKKSAEPAQEIKLIEASLIFIKKILE